MRLSPKGFTFIKGNESFRSKAYKDSKGIWTIGYGTILLNGCPVEEGMEINELVARALALGDINKTIRVVNSSILQPINQNQFDALVSFAYNIGDGGFATSSLVLAINHKLLINEDLFTRWNKITVDNEKIAIQGLTNRRLREYKLFTDGIYE